MKLLDAENPFNFSTELRNIIPVTLLAKSTETVEVLPDLRGGKAHFSESSLEETLVSPRRHNSLRKR